MTYFAFKAIDILLKAQMPNYLNKNEKKFHKQPFTYCLKIVTYFMFTRLLIIVCERTIQTISKLNL